MIRIGSRYQPHTFERRTNQGTFEARNPPMTSDELRLQKALLDERSEPAGWIAWAVVTVAIVGFAVRVAMVGDKG